MPGSEGEREKPKIHPIICTSEAQSGVQRSTQHYFSPALLNGSPGYLYPGPYAARIKSQQAKHTTFYNFTERISFAQHGKLVAKSSEFHLTLSRAHRVHFFHLEIRKKSGTF